MEQTADMPATVKDESVLVTQFPALVCEKCGYETIRGSDMPEYMRAAADVYRRRYGLLTSDEIRLRRGCLGYSQEEFAAYLEVGPASIKRWEMGQVQDRAMDKLIRVCTDLNDAYTNYERVERMLAPREYWVPIEPKHWNPRGRHKHTGVLWKGLSGLTGQQRKGQNEGTCS